MKCQACDCLLSDYESTMKSATTGEYLDMCTNCLSYIKEEITIIDRPDLAGYESLDEDEFNEEDQDQ